MVCQPVKCCFMPKGLGIIFIVHVYFHILCSSFLKCIFYTKSYQVHMSFKLIYLTRRWDSDKSDQSVVGSYGKDGVFNISQISEIGALPLDVVLFHIGDTSFF